MKKENAQLEQRLVSLRLKKPERLRTGSSETKHRASLDRLSAERSCSHHCSYQSLPRMSKEKAIQRSVGSISSFDGAKDDIYRGGPINIFHNNEADFADKVKTPQA